MSAKVPGSLIVLSGPSGVGKTSLVQALVAATPDLKLSISYTTRSRRHGEVDGQDYFFVSNEEFQRLVRDDQMVEYAEVFGNYYGTSRHWIAGQLDEGLGVVLEIDWQGARQTRKIYPEAISIMLLPPSLDRLEERLRSRDQDDQLVIERRMQAAADEMSHLAEYDYLVFNADFSRTLQELESIVGSASLRTARQIHVVRKTLPGLIGS